MPSNPYRSLGFFSLIAQADFMIQLVLLLLLGLSVLCWAIIFSKGRAFRRAKLQNNSFVTLFASGKSLEELYVKREKFPDSPIARIFEHGIQDIRKYSGSPKSEKIEYMNRILGRATIAESLHLEKQINWLATTASAAPFIGLFGTIWGIMNSFHQIGVTGAASLAVVAPGISEALFTTAAGIGAAVPAVIAYNYFVTQIRRLSADMDVFCQDLIIFLQGH